MTNSGFTVVVLAGGIGSRLKEVVSDVPKPLASVRGRPFLEYLLSYWIKNNAHHFILSIGYKYKKIMDYFGTTYNGIPITYVIEKEPLGTGGALLKVLDENNLQDNFFLINGDTLFLINQKRIIDFHTRNNAALCVSLRRVEDAGRYHCMSLDAAGRIIAIGQPNQKGEAGQINGGVYIINPGLFSEWSDTNNNKISFENDILPSMLHGHNVYGVLDDGDFIDIGIPDDYHKAQTYLSDDLLINTGVQ